MRIHKIAAATLMSVALAGGLVASSGLPAGAAPHLRPAGITGFGKATVTPSTNLVDQQVVKVKASKFPTDTADLYAVECSANAIEKQDEGYCDTTSPTVTPATNGAATFNFTILTGSDFKPAKGPTCAWPKKCYIVIADGSTLATTTTVAFPKITFKDPRPTTKTKVTTKKTAKVKKSVTLKAATTHTKSDGTFSGTATFYDNGKKLKKVKESAHGKASLKWKFKKAGKQHIEVKYSGSSKYQPSKGKTTIKITK
ncbi:MAG TPA: Ig-like domain-containing protein [Mycobacteriales bacterium]|nr:Ig-like domain-containing protein [Mycobacteriales bacterium]